MSVDTGPPRELLLQIHDLTMRLEEAEETLRAIRHGDVDAVVVRADQQVRVYALEDADHAYRVLFETLNEGALTLAADGTILYANTRVAELLGLPHAQVLGSRFPDVLPEGHGHAFRALLEAGLGGSSKGELLLRRADGALVPVLMSLNAVRIDGAPATCTAVLTDLTELRQAQESLQRANADLEAKVAARTRELIEANEALQQADRHKNEFLAMLAHELRSPLAPIRNAIELLKQWGPDEPRLTRARQIIDRQVVHQARLLEDLLDVSRISRGKIELRRDRLDLVQLIRDAAEDSRSVIEASDLTLSLELTDEPVWVGGDATRLTQIIGNLLGNAAKFTEPGGQVTVRLTTAAEHGGGAFWPRSGQRRGPGPGRGEARGRGEVPHSWAVITVRDTGIGIEPEMLPHVFETFAQADRSLDRSRGGLGLGLALVKGLVELHGGEVSAVSQGAGRGSEFTFRLPITPAPAASETRGAPVVTAGAPVRILIVEDNRDAAESLRDLLELQGCTVALAHSGPAAVAVARQFQPEVVLCDIGLPGMDGHQVAAALRSDPALARAHLIALSGYGQEEDRRRSLEMGFDQHLTKPIEFDELCRLLQAGPADERAW
jgi:PAS domain S-box-containing protein